jgi:two-component system, OmpR family, phosphate regulon sensor histidine kinase PhoR
MSTAEITLLLRDLPEPLLLVGSDNRIVVANRAATDMLGEQLVGQSAYAAIRQPEALAALDRGQRRASETGATASPPRTAEARFIHTTASAETTFRMVVTPVDPGTGLSGVLVSFHDISHIEEAEQMRRDFVANVSHELRSPLTALAGFIETLRTTARDDAAARERFLEIMEQEAGRMTRLVSDLLTLSRVEVSERVRPRDEVQLEDAIRTTLAALRPQIEDSGIRLEFDPGEGGPRVLGDRDQLIQVFHNLIENAVKYGGSGGVVQVRVRENLRLPGFSGPVVAVDVIDHGEGIDPLHIPRLTERFYRVDTHRSREMGGTGLGLAIAKHIINRHRGRLTIRSTRGEGSTFTVLLPAAR